MRERDDWCDWCVIVPAVLVVVLIAGLAVISRPLPAIPPTSAAAAIPQALLTDSHVDSRAVGASAAARGSRGPVPMLAPPGQTDRATRPDPLSEALKYGRTLATYSPGDSDEGTTVEDEPSVAPIQAGEASEPLSPGDLPEPWRSLADCETGGTFDPTIISESGTYYGLFQFSLSTWASVGGHGYPSDASVSEQLARAQTLQQIAGWDQWPYCAKQLGLY